MIRSLSFIVSGIANVQGRVQVDGILDGERPVHPVGRGAREALDQPQGVGARVPVRRPLAEVRRLDHERVALPSSARIAHVQADPAAGDAAGRRAE